MRATSVIAWMGTQKIAPSMVWFDTAEFVRSCWDVIPIGGSGAGFPVKAIEPYRALVLAGSAGGLSWVWQFGLSPLGEHQTRLISRNCAQIPPSLRSIAFMRLIEPAAFIMTRSTSLTSIRWLMLA